MPTSDSQRTRNVFLLSVLVAFSYSLPLCVGQPANAESSLRLNDQEYFATPGSNVLIFSNWYNANFDDSKISGIELIHHGVRTATNGDVRLSPTPEQWDPIPEFVERKVDPNNQTAEAFLKYPDYDFNYSIRATPRGDGILFSVHLEKPLPTELEGRAGLNLEFLPSAYFEKTFLMDGRGGTFPLYPSGPMERDATGNVEAQPIVVGSHLVLAPEDPERRVSIKAEQGSELQLYDGRNKAQNGWYVVRTLIPAGKSGKVVEWFLSASTIPDWVRPPMIARSQLGYHPKQKKVAILELDQNDSPLPTVRLLKVSDTGQFDEVFSGPVDEWGEYLRYDYHTFDFSSVTDSGLYVIEYGDMRTKPFRIANDVYENAWQPTLDIFFPVQMDHMLVNEAYRVWHGASHLDDALQAPVDHKHFDLYAQGPTTDTQYEPKQRIPGLDIGGWYDAGDFDIRTQSQYATVMSLVDVWEAFHPDRDETTVDQQRRYVDIHVPDGKPDLLQQIEHGALALVAQHRAVGHAIPGIVAAHLSQYTHLGDGSTKTDNRIYNPELADGDTDGLTSGTFDDRWAFTNKSSGLNYGSSAGLAAASRALAGYNDELAQECLTIAKRVWEEEHGHEPDLFRSGNTTGGPLEFEELRSAAELLIATGESKYADRIDELWPSIDERFPFYVTLALRARPHMNAEFVKKLDARVVAYQEEQQTSPRDNPFGVPIPRGGWAGSGWAIRSGITNYLLHKEYSELFDAQRTFDGLNYILGCHPGSNISLVSGVGTHSKRVAYGNNRADYSFIAGGVVPGVLILRPDFPENKEDWPFLWGENEYVITPAASYIYLVNAANSLLNELSQANR